MRLFRREPADRPVEVDPARQEALVAHIRQRFGPTAQGWYRDQVEALTPLLQDDDGLAVCGRIVRELAEQAYGDILAQAGARRHAVDRRNYRALCRLMGSHLRYRLAELPCGFHPYIHLAAALGAIGGNTKRAIQLTEPAWLLAYVLELLELTAAGWEFGRIPVGVDAAHLAGRLISTATQIRHAIDEPPLPPGIRDLMRSNRTATVYDAAGTTAIGAFNPGAETRRAFLT